MYVVKWKYEAVFLFLFLLFVNGYPKQYLIDFYCKNIQIGTILLLKFTMQVSIQIKSDVLCPR